MRDVLHFDREFRAELVGHDEEMQERCIHPAKCVLHAMA
jgi:hypothetical protein